MRNISWYIIVWLAVIALSLAGSFFNSLLFDAVFDLKQELPFLARWVVWLMITPFAVQLAAKVYYADSKAIGFFLYHFSIYIVISTLHILLSSALASYVYTALNGVSKYQEILIKCAITGVFYNFVVYTIIVLLQNGSRYYKALQVEKIKIIGLEKSLSDTRLEFLKQQLQPHFLFNAHHAIITFMHIGEVEKATSMLEKLSELMRIALRESSEQVIPLYKEMETLGLYLDIQKIRFEDKLDVSYSIDNNVQQVFVPGMILQPIVENSIRYAVEVSKGKSTVTVNARKENDKLFLSVTDRAMNGGVKNNIKKGVGLSNAEERLHKLYGNDYQLMLLPYSHNGYGGLEVQIKIPIQYEGL